MERSYSPEQFDSMVALCRKAIPGVTITTDVMVGFPGETEEEFDEGYHFIRGIAFDGMHVFKYSRRSGTRAARLPDQIPEAVKRSRSRLLRDEAIAGVNRLLARHAGRSVSVAWEGQRDGIWRGLTDTNVRVYGPPDSVQPGTLSRVRLGTPLQDGLWAEPIQAEIPLLPVS
jgi:threonylcarbamoyladenosine tRNA methylthiotransferase MtaB